LGYYLETVYVFFTSMFILKISHIFPNTFKYFSGISFQLENFEWFITFFFKEWINSGIYFANDIIDKNGKITQEFILLKLKNKSNWISEFSILNWMLIVNLIDHHLFLSNWSKHFCKIRGYYLETVHVFSHLGSF
jgi:hypothetical protein